MHIKDNEIVLIQRDICIYDLNWICLSSKLNQKDLKIWETVKY